MEDRFVSLSLRHEILYRHEHFNEQRLVASRTTSVHLELLELRVSLIVHQSRRMHRVCGPWSTVVILTHIYWPV